MLSFVKFALVMLSFYSNRTVTKTAGLLVYEGIRKISDVTGYKQINRSIALSHTIITKPHYEQLKHSICINNEVFNQFNKRHTGTFH